MLPSCFLSFPIGISSCKFIHLQKPYTEVTSPKSSESTISTIPADMSGRDTCSYFVVLCFYTARETEAERNA